MRINRVKIYIVAFVFMIILLPLALIDYDRSIGYTTQDSSLGARMSDVPEGRRTPSDRSDTNNSSPLIIGTQQLSGVFSPFFASNGYDKDVVYYTQTPLINVDNDGNIVTGINVHSVAYNYSVTTEDTYTMYEFIIKNGITFSDGHPIDGNDVLFNLYVYLDPLYDGPCALSSLDIVGLDDYTSGTKQSISGISLSNTICDDGVSREVVSIKINGFDSSALSKFTFFVAPMHYYAGEARHERANGKNYFGVDFANSDFMYDIKAKNTLPLGSGPYKTSDYSGNITAQADNFFVDGVCYFVANDEFMLGAPEIKRLMIKSVYSTTKADALKRETIHIAYEEATDSLIDLISSDVSYSDIRYEISNSLGYGFISVNSSVIKSKAERVALMSVFDPTLCSSVLGSMTEILYRPLSSIYDEYPEGSSPYYDFDSTGNKAFECYSSLGYSIIDGIMTDTDGNPVEYIFTLPYSTSYHPAGEIFIKAQGILAKIGVKVTINVDPDLFSTVLDGNTAVWAAEWRTEYEPDLYSLFYSDAINNPSAFPNALGLYDMLYNGTNEEITLLNTINSNIMSSRKIVEEEDRKVIYSETLDKIMELAVVLPTYQKKTVWIYNDSIVNSASLIEASAFHSPFDEIWNISLRDGK